MILTSWTRVHYHTNIQIKIVQYLLYHKIVFTKKMTWGGFPETFVTQNTSLSPSYERRFNNERSVKFFVTIVVCKFIRKLTTTTCVQFWLEKTEGANCHAKHFVS